MRVARSLTFGVALSIATLLASPRLAIGQDSRVHFAGELDLARLVDLAAERLGLNVEYDDKNLRAAKITLRFSDGVDVDELWGLTNALLTSHGFTAVRAPTGDLISIVRLQDASARAFVHPDAFAGDGGYQTIAIEPRHRTASEIADAIKPLLSKQGGAATQLGDAEILLISDQAPRVEQALRFIERIDVPAEPAVIETIDVEYVPASQLNGLVGSAAAAYAAVTGRTLRGKLVPLPDANGLMLVAPADARIR